jgi:hypothetical protein
MRVFIFLIAVLNIKFEHHRFDSDNLPKKMVNYQTNFNNTLDIDSSLAIAVVCCKAVIGICCISSAFCNNFRGRTLES